MTIFLVAVNVLLLVAVIILLVIRIKPHKTIFSSLEDIELIEFQQNLKELIDQLHKVSENEIKDMELKKKEIQETIASAEARINELRYLIDRNQLIRKSEYKSAIAAGPVSNEDLLFMEVKKPQPQEQARKQKAVPAKFVINDAPEQDFTPVLPSPDDKQGKNKYDHISSLIKNGLAVEEIAKVTGLSRGEIELIKNIKK